MKQGFNLQQTLKQTIAPQMVLQLVPLLQMNNAQIEERVKQELDDNSALEVKEHDDEKEQKELNGTDDEKQKDDKDDATDAADSYDDNDNSDSDNFAYSTRRQRAADAYTPTSVSEVSLQDYLMEQINERHITPEQQIIAQYVIGNLDSNGWLQRSASAIADDITFNGGQIEVEEEEVNEVLKMVRQLDPPGIACTTLQQCISLQLERLPQSAQRDQALEMVNNHFSDMAKHHYDRIAADMQISNDTLQQLLHMVTKTNPRPGSAYSSGASEQHSQQITPDFEVEIDETADEGNQLRLYMPNNIPELQISATYADIIKRFSGQRLDKAKKAQVGLIRRNYESATNFIALLRQRQKTLFSIMQSIVLHQKDFFLTGDDHQLRPLVLKDVAADTGLDVSVISRGTQHKYVATPWGVLPLKHFFSTALEGDVSSREVQAALKKMTDEEDKLHPLSDDALCDKLGAMGYKVARRTVAKYRERLGIAPARLRKEMLK